MIGQRHFVVHAIGECRDGALHREEVRLDIAGKAPVLAQDIGQQITVLARGLAVDVVIGAHDRGGLAVLNRHLERQQVKLAQDLIVDRGLDRHPVGFLLIRSIMLGHGNQTAGLNGLCFCHGHGAAKERVFAEIFKVAAEDRQARKVYSGRFENMQAKIVHFGRDHFAIKCGDVRIERRGCGHSRRQSCRLG